MHFVKNCLLLLLLAHDSNAQFTTTMTVEYAKAVGDSFEIYISTPPAFNAANRYNVVYYCDANLKSGKVLRELLSAPDYNTQLSNTIFVGFGHTGWYRVLRRRDFILPFIRGTDTIPKNKNYGHVRAFYSYLKEELIPAINNRYKTNTDSNAIIGHSLGGLFAFYCLFQSDNLFAKYFALSPALWIDHYAIYKFNRIKGALPGKKYLYFAAGGQETVNKILASTNDAKTFLDTAHYGNLAYEYDIHSGESHNSEVPISLRKILGSKL
jgi:predicted alpha/beta superfamily hydrolase